MINKKPSSLRYATTYGRMAGPTGSCRDTGFSGGLAVAGALAWPVWQSSVDSIDDDDRSCQ